MKENGKVARKYGKVVGSTGISQEKVKRLLNLGYLFISIGSDIKFIRDSYLKMKKSYKKLGFTFLK